MVGSDFTSNLTSGANGQFSGCLHELSCQNSYLLDPLIPLREGHVWCARTVVAHDHSGIYMFM